ncbi:hypothetical protein ACROYT_G026652 [Oculina patagonica]
MFNSPHLVYCNCNSAPVLYCPSVYSMWNQCSVPTPPSVYGASLDGMATHGGASVQGENTEPNAASRSLKFGIENILYGTLQSDHHGVHSQFSPSQELSYISHHPFTPPMRTSSRPWCRPVFTQLQRRGLEKRFQVAKYVTKRERLQIGAMLGLSETQVKVWFQNRRTKWRHEAARKEEKQKEQALKKAKSNQQQVDMTSQKGAERQENDEECLPSHKEELEEEES